MSRYLLCLKCTPTFATVREQELYLMHPSHYSWLLNKTGLCNRSATVSQFTDWSLDRGLIVHFFNNQLNWSSYSSNSLGSTQSLLLYAFKKKPSNLKISTCLKKKTLLKIFLTVNWKQQIKKTCRPNLHSRQLFHSFLSEIFYWLASHNKIELLHPKCKTTRFCIL